VSTTPRPLAGRRVVVTRPRAQADALVRGLEELGAEVVRFPTIRIAAPEDPEPLRKAAAEAASFDWIVFTSANAVERFMAALADVGGGARSLAAVRVCAIGDSTAAELAGHGVGTDLVPAEFVTESVVRALSSAEELRGRRVVLPRASVARRALPDGLRAAGAEGVEVEAYRTVADGEGAGGVQALLRQGAVDLVTFTSGSTVRGFVELVGAPAGAKVATIGPATSRAARVLGLTVDVEAGVHTVPGLVAAVAEAFTQRA
jgi:uroporphyrinogen III methyltransferase / synthase